MIPHCLAMVCCSWLILSVLVVYACCCVSGRCAQREEDAGIARRS